MREQQEENERQSSLSRRRLLLLAFAAVTISAGITLAYLSGYSQGKSHEVQYVTSDYQHVTKCWLTVGELSGTRLHIRLFNYTYSKNGPECELLRSACIDDYEGMRCSWLSAENECQCNIINVNRAIKI